MEEQIVELYAELSTPNIGYEEVGKNIINQAQYFFFSYGYVRPMYAFFFRNPENEDKETMGVTDLHDVINHKHADWIIHSFINNVENQFEPYASFFCGTSNILEQTENGIERSGDHIIMIKEVEGQDTEIICYRCVFDEEGKPKGLKPNALKEKKRGVSIQEFVTFGTTSLMAPIDA